MGDLLASVPPALVIRHSVYLRLIRRRGMAGGDEPPAQQFDKKSFAQVFANARAAQDREFGVDVLLVRYGVPAAILAIVGIAQFEILCGNGACITGDPCHPFITGAPLEGAQLAGLGAYSYVLLYLGERSLRRDLTSGAAVWSAVTMSLGPVLGAVFAKVWVGEAAKAPEGLSISAAYFVVGLSPRYAAAAISEAVRRLWLAKGAATPSTPHTIPLTEIHGITTDIEDRLGEEGIEDAAALAMAEPMKLYRNTAFDKRADPLVD